MKARESSLIGLAPSYAMPTNFLKVLPVNGNMTTRHSNTG